MNVKHSGIPDRLKIRVLFYNRTFFGGGAERAMLDYIRGLDKTRCDITVMVRRAEGSFLDQFLALQSEGVHIRTACDWIKPGKNLLQKARNFLLLSLADRCEFRFPGLFYRIAIRDTYDVEVAFMHNEAAAIIASSSNRKSKKLLWVHTDLSKLSTYKQYFRTRKRQKILFEKFDECICVSQAVKRSLHALLGLTNPVSVIHNPVDRERILTLSQAPCLLPPTPLPTVCAVGRLSWEKNFPMLLRAHAALLHKGIPHRLCIIGGGPDQNDLKALADELGIKSSVILTGHQDNPYPFIKAATVTVCSSQYEGLHIASQESLVLGVPVVSCCAVVREVFGGYECGLITDNNQSALEDGIEKMLTDPSFLKHCAAQAEIRGAEIGISDAVRQLEQRIEGRN